MRGIICFSILFYFFCGCTKDKVESIEPYIKHQLYIETFENHGDWIVTPTDPFYQPDTSCVSINDGVLKMIFDQPLENCGCAWVGATLTQSEPLKKYFLQKIGVRIKLKQGYFQYIDRLLATDEVSKTTELLLFSTFDIRINRFSLQFPNTFNKTINQGEQIDLEYNKITGTEFEVIYDEGKKTFLIDGISQNLNKINFDEHSGANQPLSMKFDLGHLPELSPKLEKLIIDEIEVYTWTGDKK